MQEKSYISSVKFQTLYIRVWNENFKCELFVDVFHRVYHNIKSYFQYIFLHLEKISKMEKKVQRKYKIRITHKDGNLHFSSTISALAGV